MSFDSLATFIQYRTYHVPLLGPRGHQLVTRQLSYSLVVAFGCIVEFFMVTLPRGRGTVNVVLHQTAIYLLLTPIDDN